MRTQRKLNVIFICSMCYLTFFANAAYCPSVRITLQMIIMKITTWTIAVIKYDDVRDVT